MSTDISKLKELPLVVFAGRTASGKGTQSKLLAEQFGFARIDTGGLLRSEAEKSTPRGIRIAEILQRGQLVSLDDLKPILIHHIFDLIESGAKGVILDGFPRNWDQFFVLKNEISYPRLIIYLNASEEEVQRRLEKRNRPDDTPESIAQRLKSFKIDTIPIIDAFRVYGNLQEVDGNRSVEEIHDDLEIIWESTFPSGN